jgi:hypothetical protein
MLWYNYLYENTMFTNKQDTSLLGKENDLEARGVVERVVLIKILIYAR